MRKPLVAGNWKMNMNGLAAEQLARDVVRDVGGQDRVEVIVCPPFPYLLTVKEVIAGSPVALGAQNCHAESGGAYTGEVSPAMLTDVGCEYVILGHSERRHGLGESDGFINFKLHAALEAGLHAILCVGETLQEREANQTEKVLDGQVTSGLSGITGDMLSRIVLAYEPVWAIGTGRNATPEQAQQAHAFLRQRVGQLCGAGPAEALLIQYGGSAKPENVASLLHQPDVDGALVGGASLQADQFLTIIQVATA